MKFKQYAQIILITGVLLLTGCSDASNKTDASNDNTATTEQSAQNVGENAFDSAAMLEDLNTMTETLEKNHKDLYTKISKEDFLAEKEKIAAEIPNMSDSEFYYALKHLVSLVGDAHTTVFFQDSEYKHLNTLPVAIENFENNWYLMMVDVVNEPYLGSKVIAINDMPIEELFEKTKTILSFENEALVKSNFSQTISFIEALSYLGVAKIGEPVSYKVEMQDGTEATFELMPLSERGIMTAELEIFEGATYALTWQEGIYRALSVDTDTLFIQYNACEESPELSMADFTKSIEKELDTNAYKTLIFDLRYNGGGNSDVIKPMLNMLKDAKAKHEFSVYTLIGKSTMSSAIINAVQFKDELGATLVGSATGGNVNHFGELQFMELPNTKIAISYSTKYFELISGYDKDSLYPDVEITQTYDDYLAGKDTAVEWVLKNE